MSVVDLLKKHSKPELRKEHGMVTEIWEDGEVTCQKCGDLYGQRSLHQFDLPCVPEWFGARWMEHMEKLPSGKHARIAVDPEHTNEIRQAMRDEFAAHSEITG